MGRAGRRMAGKSVASAVEAKSAVSKRRVMLDVVTRWAQRRNKISTSRVEVGNLDATPGAPPPGSTQQASRYVHVILYTTPSVRRSAPLDLPRLVWLRLPSSPYLMGEGALRATPGSPVASYPPPLARKRLVPPLASIRSNAGEALGSWTPRTGAVSPPLVPIPFQRFLPCFGHGHKPGSLHSRRLHNLSFTPVLLSPRILVINHHPVSRFLTPTLVVTTSPEYSTLGLEH